MFTCSAGYASTANVVNQRNGISATESAQRNQRNGISATESAQRNQRNGISATDSAQRIQRNGFSATDSAQRNQRNDSLTHSGGVKSEELFYLHLPFGSMHGARSKVARESLCGIPISAKPHDSIAPPRELRDALTSQASRPIARLTANKLRVLQLL